jgi:succinyl-CoA synthetase beta subunit
MATMDIVSQYGGSPANFLDVGGGVSAKQMDVAVRLVLSQSVRGIIVNVYGGLNNCQMMAQGICQALDGKKAPVPIVVKMRGHFEEEGWALLTEHNIPFIRRGSTDEAVKLLLQLVAQEG